MLTSSRWPSNRLRTRSLMLPCARRSCVTLSSSIKKSRLVCSVMRTAVEPICNSERARGPVHKRSPVVSGRFSSAGVQALASAEPAASAGAKLTPPSIRLSLATRPGGSIGAPLGAGAWAQAMDCSTSSRAVTRRRYRLGRRRSNRNRRPDKKAVDVVMLHALLLSLRVQIGIGLRLVICYLSPGDREAPSLSLYNV